MMKTRVLLVDDHSLFREGLASIINSQPDMEVVGEAGDGLEALVKARELKPELVLLDIEMPGMDGLASASKIMEEIPGVIIVMLTVRAEDEKLFDAIKRGAQGYLLKDIRSREMLQMLRAALQGEAALPPALAAKMLEEFRRISRVVPIEGEFEPPTLTRREQDVLSLAAQGASDKEIAEALTISLNTVKTHIRNILAKLQVSSRQEAAWVAQQKGLL